MTGPRTRAESTTSTARAGKIRIIRRPRKAGNVRQRSRLPATTHVDFTARVHTVDKSVNPRYWSLIAEFEKLSGIPIVLNTSFNENEPIVCTPQEAIACFLRTDFDALAIGVVHRRRIFAGWS